MDKARIEITKASGDKALFNEAKLKESLKRSGANSVLIEQVLEKIRTMLYNGIPTKDIYKAAFHLLKRKERISAAKYKLKRALMELGPSGYPFERLSAAILKKEGYVTQVGKIVQGKCVQHEIDVIAQRGEEHLMIECKFHSDQGRFCNVKIPLYIQSRFLDIEAKWKLRKGHEQKFHQAWIFTNTRFSTDAIQYANCMGLKLLSWDYPGEKSLRNRIDEAGLHPLTALTTLSKKEKQQLLTRNIVLCRELHEQPESLKAIGIDQTRRKKIISDSKAMCKRIEQ